MQQHIGDKNFYFFDLRSSSMVFHHHLDIQCLIGTSFLSVITLVLNMFLISAMILSLFSSPHLGCHEFNNAISAVGSFFFWILLWFYLHLAKCIQPQHLFIEFNLNTLQLFKFNKKLFFASNENVFFFSIKTFIPNKKYFYIKKKHFFFFQVETNCGIISDLQLCKRFFPHIEQTANISINKWQIKW